MKIPHQPQRDEDPVNKDIVYACLARGAAGVQVPPANENAMRRAGELVHRFIAFAGTTGPKGSPSVEKRDVLGCAITHLFFEYLDSKRPLADAGNRAQARLQALRDVAVVAPPEVMDTAGFALYSTGPPGTAVILLPHNYVEWARVLDPDTLPITDREVALRALVDLGAVMPRISHSALEAALTSMRAKHEAWARQEGRLGSALPHDLEELADELAPIVDGAMARRDQDGRYHLVPRAMRDPFRRLAYTIEHSSLSEEAYGALEAVGGVVDVVAANEKAEQLRPAIDALAELLRGTDAEVFAAARAMNEDGEAVSATAIADRLGWPKSRESTVRGALKRIHRVADQTGLTSFLDGAV